MSADTKHPFSPLAALGRIAIALLQEMGRIALFFVSSVVSVFRGSPNLARVLQQIHFIGMKSVFVVSLTGLTTGMVLGLQGYHTLTKVGMESFLGAMVALSLIRELGPVFAALMVTGRAGSSMAAELGIMRISEQIDALDTMNIEPVRFLVAPRLIAGVICFPLLTALFDCMGIIGGYLTGVKMLGVNAGTYLAHMEAQVDLADVWGGFAKSLVFAFIVIVICCYQGYTTHTRRQGFGAQGVGLSTTRAVVTASVLILVSDYVITSILHYIQG